MRKIFFSFFWIFFYGYVAGQVTADTTEINLVEINNIDVANITDSVTITNNCLVFIDSAGNKLPGSLHPDQWTRLASYNLKRIIPEYWINKTMYLKFTLVNSTDTADKIYFFPGLSFTRISLFEIQPGGALRQLEDESRNDGFQPLVIHSKQKRSFIALLSFAKTRFNSLRPQLIQQDYLKKYQTIFLYKNESRIIIGYVLSGLLLMMILFTAANYILSGKKEFLYNGCYSACMCCLVFFTTYLERRTGIFSSIFVGFFSFALLAAGTVFYIAFTRKFLDTKINHPLLNKIFIYEEKALIVLLACFTWIYFFTNSFWWKDIFENSMKVIALAIGVIYIIMAVAKRNKLMNYLAIGCAMLITFSIISFMLLLQPVKGPGIFASAMFYYEVGIVAELIFFLLGLTYKNRIQLIEKIKEQEAFKLTAEKQAFETKLAVINAQQEERNRISADMHDDLGAGVTAIRLYSELAKNKVGNESVPEIEKISSSANELLNNMNAIIWTMNSNNDSLENTIAYIRSYAIEYFDSTGINCRIFILGELPQLAISGEIRRNVFLVVKETLNNILKHAKATEVTITLQRTNDILSLHIQDNGVGIDLSNLRRFGNGLNNMSKRMQEAGIDFSVENKNGTLVTLHRKIEL